MNPYTATAKFSSYRVANPLEGDCKCQHSAVGADVLGVPMWQVAAGAALLGYLLLRKR